MMDRTGYLERKGYFDLHHSNVKLLFCILFLAGLFQVGSVSNLERDRKRKQLGSELSLARVICFYWTDVESWRGLQSDSINPNSEFRYHVWFNK